MPKSRLPWPFPLQIGNRPVSKPGHSIVPVKLYQLQSLHQIQHNWSEYFGNFVEQSSMKRMDEGSRNKKDSFPPRGPLEGLTPQENNMFHSSPNQNRYRH